MLDENFSFMLKFLSKKDLNENFVFSPFSIMVVLRCLASGAENESLQELQSFITKDEKQFRELLTTLTAIEVDSRGEENLFWTGTKVLAAIRADVKNEFKREVKLLLNCDTNIINDTEETRKMLSDWMKHKTHGKLTASEINDNTLMMLINVVYWKAAWVNQFLSHNTKFRPFYSERGIIHIETMLGEMLCKRFFLKVQGVQMSIIELFTRGKFSLVIVKLPNFKPGIFTYHLHRMIANFPENDFANKRTKSEFEVVNVIMPKMNIKINLQIIEQLKALGIQQVFHEETADLSKMTDVEHAHVGEIEHKAVFCVDESGCEAAACTSADVTDGISKQFNVNTPFFFMVLPKMTLTPIFGGVFNP